MQWGLLVPIVAISSGPIGWIATTWIRARHGYALTNRKGEVRDQDVPLAARDHMAALTQENEAQREQIAVLHQRLQVLERIATDPAARITAEIDALRSSERA